MSANHFSRLVLAMNSVQQSYTRIFAALILGTLLLTLTLAALPAQAQTYTVVYNFGSNANDPVNLIGGPNLIAQGRDGNFYSMSNGGGTAAHGTAFKITPSGTVTVLASFAWTNGLYPIGGLILGTDGNLYGATEWGGDSSCNLGSGCGTVMKITPAGVLTTLFAFPSSLSNGEFPGPPPIQGTDGNFYGSTTWNVNGDATLYKMTPTGTMTVLHVFNGTDGNYVEGQLVQGTDGNFYGGSFQGGTSNDGVLFKLTPAGVLTVLHNFTGSDGASSWGLVQGTNGTFYGATVGGGTSNAGVVFKLTSSGTYTVLYNLNGTTDGINPYSSLIQATDGNFYGVTNTGGSLGFGTIYKITPAGVYTVVHNFDNTTGRNPQSTLTQATSGLLYGDTYKGGPICNNDTCGVFYSLNIGAAPFASLVSTSGKEGAKIGILGQGFSAASVVKFGGTQATTITRTGTTFISATVPAAALTGSVTVTTGATTLTSKQTFKVKPTITSFTPPSGPVGTPVTITGTSLTQATKVTFNGTSASFTVNSDTQITATVPTGATTGKIAVTTKGGSATSTTSFTVN